jgi:hypothetical protein
VKARRFGLERFMHRFRLICFSDLDETEEDLKWLGSPVYRKLARQARERTFC